MNEVSRALNAVNRQENRILLSSEYKMPDPDKFARRLTLSHQPVAIMLKNAFQGRSGWQVSTSSADTATVAEMRSMGLVEAAGTNGSNRDGLGFRLSAFGLKVMRVLKKYV